jgi:putative ABC transport system ATP-binding protein
MTRVVAEQIGKCYRDGSNEVWVLRDVTLVAPAGALTLLTGPSGSGKTTLLSLLGALSRPSRGRVLFGAHDLTTLSDIGLTRIRRDTGVVFQSFALIGRLPVWENVTYPLIPRGLSRRERLAAARAVLARVGLDARWQSRPEELSNGEQQRVAIARAMVADPKVLIADEPTSSLDAAARQNVFALCQEWCAAGKTVIVASHDPDLTALAGTVVRLESGCINSV